MLTSAFTQAREEMQGNDVCRGGTGKLVNSRGTGWFRPLRLEGDVNRGNWRGQNACH